MPRLCPMLAAAVFLLAGAPPASASTPGEATDLLVLDVDAATGDMTLAFTPACGALSHHLEYGPLQDVGVYGYSGQVCGLGMAGQFGPFNPGAGNFFFLVVADDGAGIEGSYGVSSVGGMDSERPENSQDPVCSFVQDLSASCDLPPPPAVALTAFRPQSEVYGGPLRRAAVPDAEEEMPGVGIRINGDDDDGSGTADRDEMAVVGENDLVEVGVAVDPLAPAGVEYVLRRTGMAVRVWADAEKSAEVVAGGEAVLSLTSPTASVWVESPAGGTATIELLARRVADQAILAMDAMAFQPFTGVVIALGGEDQVPGDPTLDPGNHGMFEVAIDLYQRGYDVHMYDEDVVSPSGAGAAYNEAVAAVRDRGVTAVAIYGYSHGGGSTYDLAQRLDQNRASIGSFAIAFTGYVDSIENDSNIDIATESRLPPATGYHANYYEHPGCGFFALCGGPVAGADFNLDVNSTPWGSGLGHFTVDDALMVMEGMRDQLMSQMTP